MEEINFGAIDRMDKGGVPDMSAALTTVNNGTELTSMNGIPLASLIENNNSAGAANATERWDF